VDERGIEPHVNVIDKGERTDGTFSREPTSHSDASIIVADAHRRRGVAKVEDLDPTSSRAVAEYLSVLDDPAFSGATPVEPKVISPTDPAARYTASANSVAGYAYPDNYLIDLKHAVIVDVEATTTIRQAEVGAAKTMLDRHSPKSAETGKAYPLPAPIFATQDGGLKSLRPISVATAIRSRQPTGVLQDNPSTPAGRSQRFSMQKPSPRPSAPLMD
jgi:hypothetical protein